MKVFMSWSGEMSREFAEAFRDWLPKVIQVVVPYLSSEDMEKGARWGADLAEALDESNFGILCVTPDNVGSQWLNFEAGALARSFDQSRVSPLLFGLRPADITGPLVQFQATLYEKRDILKLVKSLNDACGDDGIKGSVDEIFEVWWPHLDKVVQPILDRLTTMKKAPARGPMTERSLPEMLTEVLDLVRSQQRLLASPEDLLPPNYLAQAIGRPRSSIHPRAAEELFTTWNTLRDTLDRNAELDTDTIDEIRELVAGMEPVVRYITRPYLAGRARVVREYTPPLFRGRQESDEEEEESES